MEHRKKAAVSTKTEDFARSLQVAAEKGYVAMVKAIVKNGADVNAPMPSGEVHGCAALLAAAQEIGRAHV